MLELDVDVGATGLDKYGTAGPRLGLLAGTAELVGRIRARAVELGMEARPMLYPAVVHSLEGYDPARVRTLVAATREVAAALRTRLGGRVHETPVTAQLRGEDILELAMARAGLGAPPLVPIEATAAFAMLLLRDAGVLTVHFAGLPPGTSAVLFKFVPPETLARFGGAAALAAAVDGALDRLAGLIGSPEAVRTLLYGT
jgi:L-seryl-tRNA(Ser) seleniumtransferase